MRFSSIPLLGLFVVSVATNVAAQTRATTNGSSLSSIPAAFQAKWREALAQCGDITETGLDIDAVGMNRYGYSPRTKSIRQTGLRSIAVTYTAGTDKFGRSKDWTDSYEVSGDGHTLTETAASGTRIRYVRCDNSILQAVQATASLPAFVSVDAIVGNWEDGGSACASIRRGRIATSIVFRGWYCESGEQSATPITLERLGDRVFTHRATDLNVIVHSGRMMIAEAGPRSRRQFGDGLYVTEAGRFYDKMAPSHAAEPSATPAQMPQLRTGAYVSFPTRCAQASNATLEWWNGQFFSGGRKHPAYPSAVGPAQPNGSQPFVADVKGWEDSRTYRVNFLVLSQSMYERDGLRYFHCSDARLPPTWRNSTPPQTAAPWQPAPNQPSPPIGSRMSGFSVQSSSPPSRGLSYGEEKGEISVLLNGKALGLTSYSNMGSGGFEGRTRGDYQCVELIQRYAGLLTGTTRITGLGNGKDVAANLPSATNGAFEYFGSGSQIAPVLGSVISINLTGELAPYGHVGIVQSVQQTRSTIAVTLFDQNWPTDVSGGWKTVTFTRGTGGNWSGVMLNNGQPMSVSGWANPQI